MGAWREVHVFPSVICPNIWEIAVLCRAVVPVPLQRGCLLVSDSVPSAWESSAVGFGLTWLKVFCEIAHGQLRPGNGIWGSTGKVIWCLGFLLAQISESFLLLGEKAVNRTNALHNGVLTCFSSLAVVTPRKTGTSLSWATQTGSPLPRAVCNAERGFFSCCSISTERLDSVLSLAPLSLAGRGQLVPSVQLPSWLKLILQHHLCH